MPRPSPDEPFDRAARRYQRARAVAGDHDFLRDAMAADLAARLAGFDRAFATVADLGGSAVRGAALTIVVEPAVATARDALTVDGTARSGPSGMPAATASLGEPAAARRHSRVVAVVADADRLPLADASVDAVVALGLHAVNDLPGALILARRALKPDGVFLAALVGGATLTELRADLLAAESDLTGGAAARVLPMVDPDAAAGLLQRAGLVDPVAEVDTLTVRYRDVAGLLRDLRASGEGNILRGRVPLRRAVLADAARRFAGRAVDGRVAVTVQVIYLTGRAPAGG